MALFSSRPATAVDDRERSLNEEIQRLEKEIAELRNRPAKAITPKPSVQTQRLPLTATPLPVATPPVVTQIVGAPGAVPPVPLPPAAPPALPSGPTATPPAGGLLPLKRESSTPDPHFNELGLRKFDVISWWGELRQKFHRPMDGPANPNMVKYLATGSVQGLRPLRYERRIARNRTLALVALLLAVLYGLAWVFLRR